MAYNHVAYKCSECGKRVVKSITEGKPAPEICARRGKTKDGKTYPHKWIVDKKF